jgi:hypothetical protein
MDQNVLAVQIVPVEIIERKIHLIRGLKVMLDSDLAAMYEVPTKVLNRPCGVIWIASQPTLCSN